MSLEASAWVLRHTRGMDPARRMVLVATADYASKDGIVFASLASISDVAGCSTQTARRTLREAVTREWLTELEPTDLRIPVEFRRIRRDRQPTVYAFTGLLPDTPSTATTYPTDTPSAHPTTPNRPSGVPAGYHSSDTQTSEQDLREEAANAARWHDTLRYQPPENATPTGTPHVWQTPSTPESPAGRIDLLFETIAVVCGKNLDELTDPARGELQRACAQLRKVAADPPEVQARARRYTAEGSPVPPGTKLSPSALAKWWPSLGVPLAAEPPADDGCVRLGHLETDQVDDRGSWCTRCRQWIPTLIRIGEEVRGE